MISDVPDKLITIFHFVITREIHWVFFFKETLSDSTFVCHILSHFRQLGRLLRILAVRNNKFSKLDLLNW